MLAFFRKYQIPLSCCFCIVLSLYIMTAAARGQLKNDPVGPHSAMANPAIADCGAFNHELDQGIAGKPSHGGRLQG